MPSIPNSHIEDAQKLTADGLVDLFTLSPTDGSGTVYFKADSPETWQGHTYEGLPIVFGGKKLGSEGNTMPRLLIGNGSVDLSPFKPLAYDGYLDSALVVHHELLLTHLLGNNNIKRTTYYRVKRVENYDRFQITLQLATTSDALGFTLPHRQYRPPAFPSVMV